MCSWHSLRRRGSTSVLLRLGCLFALLIFKTNSQYLDDCCKETGKSRDSSTDENSPNHADSKSISDYPLFIFCEREIFTSPEIRRAALNQRLLDTIIEAAAGQSCRRESPMLLHNPKAIAELVTQSSAVPNWDFRYPVIKSETARSSSQMMINAVGDILD